MRTQLWRAAPWIGAAWILLLAFCIRALAGTSELWLDEIWSLQLAERISSPLDVLLSLRHDNNHPLNTLLLWYLGAEETWLIYRAPALLAGVASVALAGLWARRLGRPEALCAMLLMGASALMIQYASEARGYAPAIAFALAALVLLDPESPHPTPARVAGFWLCCALGFLSHLSFAFAYGALGLWWGLARYRARPRTAQILGEGLLWHAPPLASGAALYLLYLRDLQIGGGPEVPVASLLAGTASLSLGLPLHAPQSGPGAALAAGLLVCGIVSLVARGSTRWLLYAAGCVALPALALLLRPSFLAPRYFLVPVALFLLLLAELAGDLYRRGSAGRIVCATALGVFVGTNALHVEPLLRYGRGQYLSALDYMADQSQGPVRVGSDHDLRTGMVVSFYARFFAPGREPSYVAKDVWPEQGTDWFVLERAVEEKWLQRDPVPRFVVDQSGNRYELRRGYPSAPLSGVDWFLYANAGKVPR